MKALVLGAQGMLGYDVALKFSKHYEVLTFNHAQADIGKLDTITEIMRSYKPNLVINCAAYTKVDDAEKEIDRAYKINAYGAGHVAIACEDIGARLIHISTDYVFDGQKGSPYKEDDSANPETVYGKSKLYGEEQIKSLCRKYYIVRTQWLFGQKGHNFIKTILALSEKNHVLKVVDDQFGCPTFTQDLAEGLFKLALTEAYGIYHLTNSGTVSWYKFTKEIMAHWGRSTIAQPCTSEEFPRPAKRPKFSALDNFHWKINGHRELRSYQEALKEFKTQI